MSVRGPEGHLSACHVIVIDSANPCRSVGVIGLVLLVRLPGTRLLLIQLRRGWGSSPGCAQHAARRRGRKCGTAVGANGFLLLEGSSFRGFVGFKAGWGLLPRKRNGPVALEADGEEVTVVFERVRGAFDAVLMELPQEARSRGKNRPARHCVVDCWNGTKENRGVGHETASQEGWDDILRLNIPEYLIHGQWKMSPYFKTNTLDARCATLVVLRFLTCLNMW